MNERKYTKKGKHGLEKGWAIGVHHVVLGSLISHFNL